MIQYDAVCRSSAHFMVVTESEFLLVDPDRSKIGWGIVHFISFLQVSYKPTLTINKFHCIVIYVGR